WQPHVAAFARRFTVILHDHRGTGESSRTIMEYSVGQMADDLLQLLDHLKIERAHLVGHSTGGAIGQTVALDAPKRLDRLVISASWTAADAYFKRLFEFRAEVLRKAGALAYMQGMTLFGVASDYLRDHAREFDAEERATARSMTPEIVLGRIAAILRFDRAGELGRIRTPTLISGARDDLITPAYFSERLAAAIPGARLAMVEHGGHLYPRVHPARFQETVLDFLIGG
ncbi:MAG: alpha/beta fold hydrolase, partial [Rhodospirillales bacterium]